MFDFFRNICKSKGIDLQTEESNNQKDKFVRYKNLVENNSMGYDKKTIATHIINVIVEYLNFIEAVQSLETIHCSQDNSLIEEIYRKVEIEVSQKHNVIVTDKIHEEDKKYYIREGIELKEIDPLKVKINELPILLNPWKGERIIDNLVLINEKNIFNGTKYSFNIQNHYLHPMNIIVCSRGNHSQLAAKIKNTGYTIVKEMHDYSNLYDIVEFDGENYVNKLEKSLIKLNYNKNILFYSGVIFEMGRYLLESNLDSVNLLKNKL